jgi:Tfp pilus assembly protein PilE
MKNRSNGFTVIEVFAIVVILGVASVLFFLQKNNLEVSARDSDRKTAINAMYYGLEEVFYKTNKYYPSKIDQTILPSVDPLLFTDPQGVKVGEADSQYRYEPVNCTDDKCKSYALRTTLENETDYIKESLNK